MTRPRVAVVADLREEHCPSMDLVAEVLISGLEAGGDRAVDPFHLCPPMTRRLTRVPWLGQRALLNTTDRVINRYWDSPRWLRGQADAGYLDRDEFGRDGTSCHWPRVRF